MKVIGMEIQEDILKNEPCWTVTIRMGRCLHLHPLAVTMFAMEKNCEVKESVKMLRHVADRMEKEDEVQNKKELLEYLKKNKEEEERKDNKFSKLTESIAEQMEKLKARGICPKYLIIGKAEYDTLNALHWWRYQSDTGTIFLGLIIIPNLTVDSQLTVTVDMGQASGRIANQKEEVNNKTKTGD